MGSSAFGGWYSLPHYTRHSCGCNGTYIPRTWSHLRRSGTPTLHAMQECLPGNVPCRFFVALPSQYMHGHTDWHTHSAHVIHTLAEGWSPTAECDITYMIVCNSAAIELWPINNALLVAHVGPILRKMRIPIRHIPPHMRTHVEPCGMPGQFKGRATDPPLPADARGRRAFWDVRNTELKLRERIMTHRPLNW